MSRRWLIYPSLAASVMLLTACETQGRLRPIQKTVEGIATETEKEMCIAWANSLPSRSNSDTTITRYEIGKAYETWEIVCLEELKISHTPWWNRK